mmetsp:Transcript_13867/g.15335  ORF Transcript_13867/g.15335 Transcript_13867/m.15335 type:complete len:264 (+) Transcript_13867:43-834(+)
MTEMDHKRPTRKSFKVLGVGLPRTGTVSTKVALEHLYRGKCYHMFEALLGGISHLEFWRKVDEGNISSEELAAFFQDRGFVASVDHPASTHFREMIETFPDVKVILTVRDPDQWYESIKVTILPWYRASQKWPLSLHPGGKLCQLKGILYKSPDGNIREDDGIFGACKISRERAIQFYHEWNESVKQYVPEDRLLIFNVKEGWEPLCNFLDLPVPRENFPKLNDAKRLSRRLVLIKANTWFIALLLPFLSFALTYEIFLYLWI